MNVSVDSDEIIAARVDERARWRRLVPVVGTAVAVVLTAGYVALVDPNEGGHYPACPTQTFFGIDCPGCGGIRSAHALLRGDLTGAADHNIAALMLFPVGFLVFIAWARTAWIGVTPAQSVQQFRRRSRVLIIAIIALFLFGIVRNFVPFLGSGLSPG